MKAFAVMLLLLLLVWMLLVLLLLLVVGYCVVVFVAVEFGCASSFFRRCTSSKKS
jgi:hypothetical protein